MNLTMEPENERTTHATYRARVLKPNKKPMRKTVWQRSWTIRILRNSYAPVIIAFFGIALAFTCLYVFFKAEAWILHEKVTTVAPWTYVRVAKAAEMTTEQYIRLVFGKEAPTALAVAKAESGMRCDAQHVNRDHSVDVGAFQINSVHLSKSWKLGDLLDCKKNILYAKEIRDGSGWCAWVSYQKMNPKQCK